jgi:hypothetical protein
VIPGNRASDQTLVFWGAGATQALGIRTTPEQAKFIHTLAGESGSAQSLDNRVAQALAGSDVGQWRNALVDLITILGDSDEADRSIHIIHRSQLDAMRRNWKGGASEDELERRIVDLRLTYDWPALKSVVRVCPGARTKIRLNDLFNLLDLHIPSGFGFRGPFAAGDGGAGANRGLQFLDARRLIGAKNALLMLLMTSFYVDYQVCIAQKRDILEKYKDFATMLGRGVLRRGLSLAHDGEQFDDPRFYQDDIAFVSLNYDPILLWVQWIANGELNHGAAVPHIGSPPAPLLLFNDFGHLIPSRSVGKRRSDFPWCPMNEAAVQRLNERGARAAHKVRLTKILFPHGCLCWRECPDCGKLSAYHGDEWNLASPGLLPPPPLLAFDVETCSDRVSDREKRARAEGIVDARGCLHCGTLNYANHTQVVMQSSFKTRPPSFIEEIQRDLQATIMQATHIIFMGYSLPPDDVTYRALFAARSQREQTDVRCSVVNKDVDNPNWYGPDQLKTITLRDPAPVDAAREVFGAEGVRFYGGGIPEVFLDRGLPSKAKMDRLLTWSA